MKPPALLKLAILALFSAAAWSPAGVCAEGDKDSHAIQFRRIYAPADRPSDWPMGGVRYLPMDAGEFERLVGIGGTESSAAVSQARWTKASYQASLTDDDLLTGKATLDVVSRSDAPVLASLHPCGPAISHATWQSSVKPERAAGDGEERSRPAATMGLDARGRLQVVVDSSDKLDLEWSLRGRREAGGAVNFDFKLPRCPTARLLIDLPEHLAPTIDKGIVLSDEPTEGKLSRWRIELGGHNEFRLRIAPKGAADNRRQLALVRQAMVYDFSLRGLEVSTDLDIEVHNGSLDRVELLLDSGLQLVEATYGEEAVPWLSSRVEKSSSRVVLNLPQPIAEAGGTLRVRALAPLVMDRSWRLPGIRPQGIFWQEGSATLLIPDSLSVKQISTVGCRQSEIAPLPYPRSGESLQFQYFTADAAINAELGPQDSTLQVASVAEVQLGGGGVTGRVAAELSVVGGPRFSIDAGVKRLWQVDSVETEPSEALEDWTMEGSSRNRRLHIRLAKALSPAQQIRIIVNARRLRSPLGSVLQGTDLSPLTFDSAKVAAPLISVRTQGPYRLVTEGDQHLKRVDFKTLDQSAKELVGTLPPELLFVDDGSADDLALTLQSRKPGYASVIRVDAKVGESVLNERYRIRCEPESAGVERVVVQFSRRREKPPRWSLVDADDREFSARELSIEDLVSAGLPPAEESWEIDLRRPLEKTFEISAVRSSRLSGKEAVSLAGVPEAESQIGTLSIRSFSGESIEISNGRLESLSTQPPSPGSFASSGAAYRYDPAADTNSATEPAIAVSGSKTPPVVDNCVWSCRLQSCYESAGEGRHCATYRVQRNGRQHFLVTLPPGTSLDDLKGVWVDGKNAVWHVNSKDGQEHLQIDLPAEAEFVTVSIYFVVQAAPLPTVGSLAAPFPKTDVPVLSKEWTAWLPPGFDAASANPRWQGSRKEAATWSRRLFGIFGRDSFDGLFDPLSAESWTEPFDNFARRKDAQKRADQLLQLFGSLAAQSGNTPGNEASWAQLLDNEAIDSLNVKLLIDQAAFDRLTFKPSTPVRVPGSEPSAKAESTQDGVALLQRANLAILVSGDEVLITGQTEAAINRASLEPLNQPETWFVKHTGFAGIMSGVAAGNVRNRIVLAKTWIKSPPPPGTHWNRIALAGHEPNDTCGWSAVSLNYLPQGNVEIEVSHRRTIRSLGLVIFLALVALGWWQAADRTMLLIALAGVFGLIGLVVPETFVPITSAAFLAALCCLLLGLIRREPAEPEEAPASEKPSVPSTVSLSARTGIGLLLLAPTVLASSSAFGQGASQPAPPEKKPLYDVFIPVDDEQKPTGDRYQVPAEFYKELHRRATAAADKPQGWLISAATYRGVLSRDTATQRLAIEELNANFDLNVFGRSTRVRIPADRRLCKLLPDGTTLDGVVIQPEWAADGNSLIVEVAEPGEYRLELSLRPAILSGGAASGFDLATPQLASSRLELSLPEEMPTISVPTAVGKISIETAPSRLIAELGPSDKLQVRWPSSGGTESVGPDIDVEELLWLNVQPGWVVLDARFTIDVSGGQIETLRLLGDSRLRLLPLKGEDPPEVEVRAVPGQPKVFLLRWDEPVSERVELQASFLVTGTSGIGNLRLPQLHVADAKARLRFVGVSIDSELEHDKQNVEGMEALAVPDFLGHWGEAPSPPQFAYKVTAEESSWSMATFPRQPRTYVSQELILSFAKDEAVVQWDAELETVDGVCLQHRLIAPSSLQVESVSLQWEGVERVARWAKNRDGSLTVFLTGPVDGPQDFSLRGSLPIKTGASIGLPKMTFRDAELESSVVELYRRPSALVEASRLIGLEPSEAPLPGSRDAKLGRLVGAYRSYGEEPGRATLKVSANASKIESTQLTRMYCGDESCVAKVDFRVLVEEGVVDDFRVDAPESWQGPYRLDASQPATLKIVDIPGASPTSPKRQLIVRPDEAISGLFRFSIISPMTPIVGSREAVPNVDLNPSGRIRRLVVLPTRNGETSITWETRGLETCQLPPTYVERPAEDAPAAHEVAGEVFSATRRHEDATKRPAVVRLADICLSWQVDGNCRGAAAFDLEPGNLSECPLRLPADFKLLQSKVNGIPAVLRPDAAQANSWLVSLGPKRVPQRIEVVFLGKSNGEEASGTRELFAPVLGDLPVERTVWTVASPKSTNVVAIDAEPISNWRYELSKLKNVASRIASAAAAATEDEEENARWYRYWARRLISAGAAVDRCAGRIDDAEKARSLTAELDAIEESQTRIARDLGSAEILVELSDESPMTDDCLQIWSASLAVGQEISHWGFDGPASIISIEYRPESDASFFSRFPAIGVFLLAVGLTAVAVRRGILAELFARWPHLLVVLAGLAWWLWLWPSALGLLIVIACLASLARSGWKRPGGSDSTVIRPLDTPT